MSWAEYRNLLALAEKKAVDAVVALVVTDINSALVSFKQTHIEISDPKSATTLSEPVISLQEVPRADRGEHIENLPPEGISNPEEHTATEDQPIDPSRGSPLAA